MSPSLTALGRAQGLAQGLPKSGRQLHAARPGRRHVATNAAVASTDTDLRSLFADALVEAPKKAASKPPQPAPAPAPVVVEAAPPAGPVPDLPGTEILPSPLPAPVLEATPPAAPTQGVFGVDAWKAAQEAVAVPTASAPIAESIPAAAEQLNSAVDSLSNTTSAAVSQASEAAAQAAGTVGGAVSDAASVLTQGVGGAASAIGGTVGQAADVAGSAAAAATAAVGGVVGGAVGKAADVAGSTAAVVSGAVGKAADVAGSTAAVVGGAVGDAAATISQITGRVTSVVSEEAGIIKANVDSAVGTVQSSVAAVEAAVGGAVGSVYDQLPEPVKSVLVVPEPVKDAVKAAGTVAGGTVGQLLTHPQPATVALGVAAGLPVLLLWQAVFGGYSGNLDPEEAMQVLQKQDALLVDVRTEAQRLQDGIAELRRGALGKGAAVPPVQLLPSLARRVKNSEALALEILAAQIVGLAKVRPSTKIIIMDSQGKQAKAVARAVAAAGAGRAYVLKGGFKAWQAAGLKVREGVTEYDASVVDALTDEVEVLTEVTTTQLSKLKDPKTAATVLAATSALGYAALNFHSVLQFIGVVGLEWTLYSKYSQYDSPEAALEDLQQLLSRAAGAVSGAGTLLPKAAEGGERAAPAAAAATAEQPPQQQQQPREDAANSQPVA